MPIKPENRARYPKDWQRIRAEVLLRAGNRCECIGECGIAHERGRCFLLNGEHVRRGDYEEELGTYRLVKIVLTIAHRKDPIEDVRLENLFAACQRCHLRYDSPRHQLNASETRDRKRGQSRLF